MKLKKNTTYILVYRLSRQVCKQYKLKSVAIKKTLNAFNKGATNLALMKVVGLSFNNIDKIELLNKIYKGKIE